MLTFFNDNAFDVCVWSYQEKDRIKASKIYKVAQNMESRYRKHHHIGQNATKLMSNVSVTFPRQEFMAKVKAQKGLI